MKRVVIDMKLSINEGSILSKIKSNTGVIGQISALKGTEIAANAAQDFVNAINSGAPGVLGGSPASTDSITDLGGYKFKIGISIIQDSRPSLVPDRYGGIDDIFALFNNGYTAGAQVHGVWHGRWVGSLIHRDPLNFVQSGVNGISGGDGYVVIGSPVISDRFETGGSE